MTSSTVEYLRPAIHTRLCVNPKPNNGLGFFFLRRNSRVSTSAAKRCVSSLTPLPKPLTVTVMEKRLPLFGCNVRRRSTVRVSATGPEGDSGEKSEPDGQGSVNGKTPSNSPAASNRGRGEKEKKESWWRWKWRPIVQAQEIGILLLQLGIVIFVMRLLRPGIPLPGSDPRPPPTFVSVPYSDFLSKINTNQVQKVEVDGVHVMFKLKSESADVESEIRVQESEALLRPAARRVVYTTTRPLDIKTPYEKMLENEVEFGSPDKRSGGFMNSVMVS